LLINRPEISDADFTWDDFAMKVNTELWKNLGNGTHRILSFVEKNFDKVWVLIIILNRESPNTKKLKRINCNVKNSFRRCMKIS
jgi:methionyl-tRNA synthetase